MNRQLRRVAMCGIAAMIPLVAACGSHVGGRSAAPAASTPTSSTPLSTPVTGTEGVTPSTQITAYPNPYKPTYDTIAELFHDTAFVVLASVGAFDSVTNGYPLNVEQSFVQHPDTLLEITPQEFNAGQLSVGSSYIFFYAIDPSDQATCIVGGTRGVFKYDPSSQTVSRIGSSSTSQISVTQTLAEFQSQLNAAASSVTGVITNPPPACETSATGLPAS